MTRPRLITLAVLAGAVAGGGVAGVQAAGDEPAPRPRTAQLAQPAPAPVVETGRLPDGRYDRDYAHLRVRRGTLREAIRMADPAGGPDWVVRSFDADRIVLKKPVRSLRDGRVVGRNRCIQLAREDGGRFGWIYGDGRFRETPIRIEADLTRCGSRRRPGLLRETREILDLGDFAAPRVTHEVLWGEAPRTERLELTGIRREDARLRLGGRGAFLLVTGKGTGLADGTLSLDGRRVGVLPSAGRTKVRPGSERVEARAPDVAGGPPRGVLVAELPDGTPCAGDEGQIVEDRLGGIDTRLGTFGASRTTGCTAFPRDFPEDMACNISTGYGGGQIAEDPLLRRARIERRLLPGRLTVFAMCRPGVERVTLRTPRDVRSLKPSPFARVVAAMYDGDFPSGDLEFTAHLEGGRTWKQKFSLGF